MCCINISSASTINLEKSQNQLCSHSASEKQWVAVCVAVYCSAMQYTVIILHRKSNVLQCVAMCSTVLQCVVPCSTVSIKSVHMSLNTYVAVCCIVLQCVAMRSTVSIKSVHMSLNMYVAVCCNVFKGLLTCIAVYCSVLQCIAVYCSVLQCIAAL